MDKITFNLAKQLYDAHTANDPIIHPTRFANWDELDSDYQFEWIEKAKHLLTDE